MKRGRPAKRLVSTCWDSKLTEERPRKKTKHVQSIHQAVEAGARYFWSRRRVSQYGGGAS